MVRIKMPHKNYGKERCKYMCKGWAMPYRCSRHEVKDGFCRQHHPDAVKARKEKFDSTKIKRSKHACS
jgi:hypothetical protein